MKSPFLHASFAALALVAAACTASAPKSAPSGAGSAPNSTAIAPGTQVATLDGQPITYGDLEKEDPALPTKVRQAEVEYLTKVHDARRAALEELISKKLLEGEAKKAGKSLDEWFKKDFIPSLPGPNDADAKAFFEEHKAQMSGQDFEAMKPRIIDFMKQQSGQKEMAKKLDVLKAQHGVKVSLAAPNLPRMEVEAKGPSKGPASAPVTIVEFSDFQCPYCSKAVPTVDQVMKNYQGKVKLVFRQFPLDFHPFAAKAAEAGLCAADQNKFWEMHDKMFADQQKLAVEDLKKTARGLGLDGDKFDKCLDSGEKKVQVEADQKAGSAAGVNGTPAFFINGLFLNGAVPYEQFKDKIDAELAAKG